MLTSRARLYRHVIRLVGKSSTSSYYHSLLVVAQQVPTCINGQCPVTPKPNGASCDDGNPATFNDGRCHSCSHRAMACTTSMELKPLADDCMCADKYLCVVQHATKVLVLERPSPALPLLPTRLSSSATHVEASAHKSSGCLASPMPTVAARQLPSLDRSLPSSWAWRTARVNVLSSCAKVDKPSGLLSADTKTQPLPLALGMA